MILFKIRKELKRRNKNFKDINKNSRFVDSGGITYDEEKAKFVLTIINSGIEFEIKSSDDFKYFTEDTNQELLKAWSNGEI